MVRCNFRAIDTGAAIENGTRVTYNARALVVGDWPGGPQDTTSVVTYRDRKYVLDGFPLRRDGSRKTAHWQINLVYAQEGAHG